MDTVLLVDDDPGMLALMPAILREEGYEVLTAANGVEGKAAIEADWQRISAVILDWTMPKMSGIELLKWVKDQPVFQYIPVIMHTVLESEQHVKEGIDAGAFYYLPKPARREVVLSVLRAAIFDFEQKKLLFRKLRESENPYGNLLEGQFRFRTLSEGEYIGLRIANACPVPERASYLMEMIMNAIEHGSLGITYAQKTELVRNGNWLQEIDRRLSLPENARKHIHIHVRRFPEKMTVLVRDEGPGFDFRKFLELDESRLMDNHGRGIAMAKVYLGVEYLDTGNTVLVTIPFDE